MLSNITYINKLRTNVARTRDLSEDYHRVLLLIGFAGLLLAFILFMVGLTTVSVYFGRGTVLAVILILPVLLLALLLGLHLAAAIYALAMVKKGNLTMEEAIDFARYCEYPKSWFEGYDPDE